MGTDINNNVVKNRKNKGENISKDLSMGVFG